MCLDNVDQAVGVDDSGKVPGAAQGVDDRLSR